MATPHESSTPQRRSRRDFLKTSSALALGSLSIARSAHAQGSDTIRLGIVGCGGRGAGAGANALAADPGTKLVAMSDLFEDRVRGRRDSLKKANPDRVVVDDDHCFAGLDGYKKVIDSVDVVLIACAAKFHPMYLKAGIEAGKHVFVEKPHGIDPAGMKVVAEATALAKEKKLGILSGLHTLLDQSKDLGLFQVHQVVDQQGVFIRFLHLLSCSIPTRVCNCRRVLAQTNHPQLMGLLSKS